MSKVDVGLPLGCDKCVLPKGYAGPSFLQEDGRTICSLCSDHKPPTFLGEDQLVKDLDLLPNEKVGVTVSGGKDSLFTWTWLVDRLGKDKVIAFNHQKDGLVHPKAEDNLHKAEAALGSELVQIKDTDMKPRFQKNFEAWFQKPDAAMVRAALCAGCRFGISGKVFFEGLKRGINKYVNAASYLELAPFKAATMKAKGNGNEKQGLINGIVENPAYDHGNNVQVMLLEDEHCHKSQLTGGGSMNLYPNVRFFDMDQYQPNIPVKFEDTVRKRLNWDRPERSWHFDCQVEPLKDALYYGLLGYTETDNNLSSMVRHGLLNRDEAIEKLVKARKAIIDGKENVVELMNQLGVGHLIPAMREFYKNSPFLSKKS